MNRYYGFLYVRGGIGRSPTSVDVRWPLLPDPEIEPQSFELDRVWLRFRDPAVEAVFLSETVRSSINAICAPLESMTYSLLGPPSMTRSR